MNYKLSSLNYFLIDGFSPLIFILSWVIIVMIEILYITHLLGSWGGHGTINFAGTVPPWPANQDDLLDFTGDTFSHTIPPLENFRVII